MARIAIRREAFEQGQFPPVCCKTGTRAEVFRRWEFSNTPGWTWILLLFGIFPFLIATAFVTQRFSGVLPLSGRADGRLTVTRRLVWSFGVAAVACFALGLVRFGSLIPIAIAFAVLCLLAIASGWLLAPNANLDGPDVVVLSNVHRGFVDAIRAIPAAPAPPSTGPAEGSAWTPDEPAAPAP
jgi:hypothetical protein